MPASCAGFYEATTSRLLFRPQALQIALTHALSPIGPFRLDSRWVKSQNESDRDAIPKRPVLHPTYSPGPLRVSRAVASTHVGRKECLQCVTTV
jgi:hypothetical protein